MLQATSTIALKERLGVDNFQKLKQKVQIHLLVTYLVIGLGVAAIWWRGQSIHLSPLVLAALSLALVLAIGFAFANYSSGYILEPLKMVWQAILHIAPDSSSVPAPNIDELRLGHDLVNTLVLQVYQFASQQDSKDLAASRHSMLQAASIVSRFPLPLFVLNKEQLVTIASDSALTYCELESAKLFGKPVFDNLNLEFSDEYTLESWINDCQKNKVTDSYHWKQVRVRLKSGEDVHQCDVAAYYNRDNPTGTEFIITLFDHTAEYSQADQAFSFMAIAVHELRTPLTVLRGYVEVFQDELNDKLDDEMKDFMHKMKVAADQLTAFVNNILNVARVEENQLTLQLTEENWANILNQANLTMQLHAQVHQKVLEFQIAPNLPTVGVDPVTILEVINNLIDNAIKYSAKSRKIIIRAGLTKDGLVETTVEDQGVGIPEGVLPHLFEKFYRNHRTRGQIGGTGLGLFLSKAIVTAHGGHIWVKSKPGQGSTFGFTVLPYARLADEVKNSNNKDIVHQAHGWIKNHSLYRK